MNRKKLFALLIMFSLVPFTLFAQKKMTIGIIEELEQKSNYVFLFSPQDDMLYAEGSEQALEQLKDIVRQHIDQIREYDYKILVTGYCSTFDNKRENIVSAKTRSNRVKSELILNAGAKETDFVTWNRSTSYQKEKAAVVVVIQKIDQEKQEEITEAILQEEPSIEIEAPQEIQSPTKEEPKPIDNEQSIEEPKVEAPIPTKEISEKNKESYFSVGSNLLYDVALTPNLSFEWRIDRNWAVNIDGLWAHWDYSNDKKRYRIWAINPELRYYLEGNKPFFVGTMFHVGEMNMKFGKTGRQGNFVGGSITGGYVFNLNKNNPDNRCFLEVGAGVGYLHIPYDKYTKEDNIYCKVSSRNRNYIGITQLNVSFIYRLGKRHDTK